MTTLHELNELAPQEVAPRLGALRDHLASANCDALIVTKLENIRYLTGFSGSAGTLVVTATGAALITDGRYRDQAAEQLRHAHVDAEVEVVGGAGALDAVVKLTDGIARLGLEADSCTWSQQRRYAERLDSQELVATTGLVEQLRVIKDPGELAWIELACDIADVALAQVKQRLTQGVTESEFAAELEFEMRQRGSSGPSFSTIVASGPNSAMPHARPTERQIVDGDLVVIDFGATVDGYRSDMTRTFSIGDIAPELVDLLDAVDVAQRAGLLAVAVGTPAGDVDRACRELLADAGFGEAFLHSTGHGVGLEIHEAPWVAQGSTDNLAAGTIVTVEPGAYLAGRGGVRVEDTVVVTKNGARALTKLTKDHTP